MKIAVMLASVLLMQTACAQAPRLDAVHGEPITIKPSVPPTGIELFQVLLENAAMPLQGTACADERPTSLTLLHQLAQMLGEGLDVKEHKTNLESQCIADGFEVADKIIDTWKCGINVTYTTKEGEYISNASMDVGLTRDTWEYVPGTLLCL